MKSKSRSKKLGLVQRILIITFLICSILFITLYLIFPQVMSQRNPLQKYTSASVLEICTTLNIPSNDEFCMNQQEQNGETFLALIEDYYPASNSTYPDFIPFIDEWETSAWSCTDEVIYGDCPPPGECQNYSANRRRYLCSYNISFTEASSTLKIWD